MGQVWPDVPMPIFHKGSRLAVLQPPVTEGANPYKAVATDHHCGEAEQHHSLIAMRLIRAELVAEVNEHRQVLHKHQVHQELAVARQLASSEARSLTQAEKFVGTLRSECASLAEDGLAVQFSMQSSHDTLREDLEESLQSVAAEEQAAADIAALEFQSS